MKTQFPFVHKTCFSLALILAATPLIAGELNTTIDRIAQGAIDSGMAPGISIAVTRDGKIIHAAGYGLADIENDVAVTAKTNFRIASITKSFTAAAIMQLVEADKIELSDPITKHIPDYNTHDHTITVQQLLNHTSGIPNYTEIEAKDRTAWRRHRSHEEMRAIFEDKELDFEPGMSWHYSNSGYYLLGMIIEKAGGVSYQEYLDAHLIAPAGLSNTQYGGQRPLIDRRSRGYERTETGWVNAQPISMTTPFSAGAVRSTATDLVTWHRTLIDGTLLTPEAYRNMITVVPLPKGLGSHSYAAGFYHGELDGRHKITHPGGIEGFSSQLSFYPDEDLTIAVFINRQDALCAPIEHQIARAVLGLPLPEPKDLPLTAQEIDDLSGSYFMGSMGIHLTEKEGKLQLAIDGFIPPMDLSYQGNGELWLAVDPDTRISIEGAGTPTAKARLMFMDMEMVGIRSK
jgi:CubicO group peptidase (beta-lactamase class C family)